MTVDLSKVLDFLNSLYGMPKVILVFFLCLFLAIAINYVIQRLPAVPNYMTKIAVPCILPLVAALALPLVSTWEKSSIPTVWQFIVVNMLVGIITGLVAWMAFAILLLKRLEKYALNGGTEPPFKTYTGPAAAKNNPLTPSPDGTIKQP